MSDELDQYERELERAEKEKVNFFRRRRHSSEVQYLRSLCASKKSNLKSKQDTLEEVKKVVNGTLTTNFMDLISDSGIEFETYKIHIHGKEYPFAFAFISGNYRDCKERARLFSDYKRITEKLREMYRESHEKGQRIWSPSRCLLPISDFFQYFSEDDKKQFTDMRLQTSTKSKEIIQTAQTTFPLIDFRDWENVDLLIYYFETGRADDMKEALQLVDKQRQADQITEAIEAATESICKTINVSMTRLGSALSQSFSVLSRQMAQQHIELMEGMDRQAETQIREIREQTAEQRNAQAMNQALLDKISVSSKHLAEQMDRQMRSVHGLY